MNDTTSRLGRLVVVVAAAVVAVAVGVAVFVRYPESLAELLGVVLVVALVPLAARIGGNVADSVFPTYNAAEVSVEGPIARNGGGAVPSGPTGPGADEIVEQIDRADEDDTVDALLVELNTPGGQVVPSDDIRRAAAEFDGLTLAYATDVCASGGYWIASGCDELWAREGSVVGSIGVRSPRFTATDLLDRLGVDYQGLTAGEYKEAGSPFTEMDEDDRDYLQGIVDAHYENFVETVAEGRNMNEEFVRQTEAKVYLGEDAADLGLVDHLGTRDEVVERAEDVLDQDLAVREFQPSHGLSERLRGGAASVAYAFGAGLASVVADEEAGEFRL
jgi:protease-4